MTYTAPPTFTNGTVPTEANLDALSADISGGLWRPLAEVIVSGSPAASIDISGIPATFRHLKLVCMIRGNDSAATSQTRLRFNGDSGGIYHNENQTCVGTSVTSGEAISATSIYLGTTVAASGLNNSVQCLAAYIPNYRGTTFYKGIIGESHTRWGTSGSNQYIEQISGWWGSAAAITQITLIQSANNFYTGSTLTLFGLPS